MSLWPLLFSAWWSGLDQPHTLMDQNFGMCLCPDDLRPLSWTENYYFPKVWDSLAYTDFCNRPSADLVTTEEICHSTIPAGKDTFKVILDVKHFKPEEVNVRIVNRFVIIEAKHEEKKDQHGLISRQFDRKFCVPEQVDIDQLKSTISSDGILTITAPVKKQGKVIKVEQTGKPASPESVEKSKETLTDKADKTEKEKASKVEQTGKPAIQESVEKPKETSTDKADKTEKGNVSKVQQTGKPVIQESAEKAKETSTDKHVTKREK